MILAYGAFVILKRVKESNNGITYDTPSGAARRLKVDDDSVRAISPVTPTSEESYTYMSPVSDRSSSGSSTSKKRRSYDKTYRTNEPLKGLPEVEFEEKQWDLDASPSPISEYEPDNKPTYSPETSPTKINDEYAAPVDNYSKRHTYIEPEPQTDKTDGVKSASNPNLIDNRYTLPDYATVNKDRNKARIQSQSSIITDV